MGMMVCCKEIYLFISRFGTYSISKVYIAKDALTDYNMELIS
jgi:hypothetical protein